MDSKKNENKKAEKRFQFEQERNECLKKKQRLIDIPKALNDDYYKYSMEACSVAHDTSKLKKDAGTALQSKRNEIKGKWAIAWNKGGRKNNWDIK